MAVEASSGASISCFAAFVRMCIGDLRFRVAFETVRDVDSTLGGAMKTALIDRPGVAELADAQALGACDPRGSVQVQVLPPGPRFSNERSVLTLDRSGEIQKARESLIGSFVLDLQRLRVWFSCRILI